jgi:hypothetical protein
MFISFQNCYISVYENGYPEAVIRITDNTNVHKHLVVTYIERYMVSKGASGFDIIIHSLF